MTDPLSTDDKASRLANEAAAAGRVTVIGMMLDLVLGAIKCVAGTLFHSQALMADGVHSLSDAASDLIVIAVMKASRRGPDQGHPYGHQRIETLGTMLLGSTLIAVGAALAWDNVLRLLDDRAPLPPEWPVLAAAALSIAAKEWIYRYTRRVGQRIRSDLIIANAWHSRTDALSSIIVLVSVAGAMVGWIWLDALAAIAIALIVGHIGWGFAWRSVKELVDSGIPAEEIERLTALARSTEGVRNVHELRSRKMGRDILLDVHLVVSPDISVSEGHQIGMHVVERMRESLTDLAQITFHIDAENDEVGTPTSLRLPNRQDIERMIAGHLGETLKHDRLRLHYLRNKVHLELFVESGRALEVQQPLEQLHRHLEAQPWFGSLRIWQSNRH